MTADEYTRRTGGIPVDDDLDRVNCDKAGEPGHFCCGWCDEHDTPVFSCLHLRHYRDGRKAPPIVKNPHTTTK